MLDANTDTGDPSFLRELARITASITPFRPTPTMHEIWLRTCAQAFDPHDAFEIIAAGDPETSAASFFRRRRSGLTPRLFLCGSEDAGLLTDAYYEDKSGAEALARAVVTRGLPIRFGPFPADSLFVDALQAAAAGKAYVLVQPLPGLSFIQLDETWLEPEQNFNTGRKAELRRRRKKAQSRGDIAVEIISPDPQNVDALLEEVIAVEGSGWKGETGTSIASNKNALAFFQIYARLASEAGIFRLCFYRIDGKAAAVTIGVECDGAFWQYKVGYDEAYKNCSPGTLLLVETVRHAANAGLSRYEFLGHASWMKEWTTDEHPLVRFNYYPFNPAGAAALASDGLNAAGRKVKSRLGRKSR